MVKDMVWHALYEGMESNQCPVCELVLKRTKSFMASILYEGVNDPVIREKIKASHGLCNYHAMMWMGSGDPLAHALIYHDLIQQTISDMNAGRTNQEAFAHTHCLFCEQAGKAEEQYWKAFADAFADTAFQERYQNKGLLCYPHYLLISDFKGIKPGILNRIKEFTIQKYRFMLDDLKEIQHKSDYRFSREPWTDDLKSAWKKAVYLIHDKTGIRK